MGWTRPTSGRSSGCSRQTCGRGGRSASSRRRATRLRRRHPRAGAARRPRRPSPPHSAAVRRAGELPFVGGLGADGMVARRRIGDGRRLRLRRAADRPVRCRTVCTRDQGKDDRHGDERARRRHPRRPGLSGVAGERFGWRAVFVMAAGLTVLITGLLAARLPHSRPAAQVPTCAYSAPSGTSCSAPILVVAASGRPSRKQTLKAATQGRLPQLRLTSRGDQVLDPAG